MERLARFLPSPEQLRENRWLRWMGPALHHPRLWHLSRRGLALGVALGIFFGLLIPLAQIPFAAAAAVALRANLPAAVASTLVTNPATLGPIYFAAWKLGAALLGDRSPDPKPAELTEAVQAQAQAQVTLQPQTRSPGVVARLRAVGKPLMLGLAVLAATFSFAAYYPVSWLWIRRVRWRRRRRVGRSAVSSREATS
jgi:uncharacterized protein (DUF2062 family)